MTKPLPIRAELPPEDATIVIRAGVMTTESLVRAAQRSFDLYAVFGLSVEGVVDSNVLEACRGPRISPYSRIRLSTFGRVREAGFAVLPTFGAPHYTIVLADLSALTIRRLERCFDPSIPNPARAPRR